MQKSKATIAGVIGALGMTLLMGILRLLGMQLNLELILGAWFTKTVGPLTWLLGLAIHLAAGALFGVAYGAIFEHVLHRASLGIGACLGVIHGILSGLVLTVFPDVHPLVPEILPSPGAFMLSAGAGGLVAYLVLHVVYGAIVGSYYKPILFENRRVRTRDAAESAR